MSISKSTYIELAHAFRTAIHELSQNPPALFELEFVDSHRTGSWTSTSCLPMLAIGLACVFDLALAHCIELVSVLRFRVRALSPNSYAHFELEFAHARRTSSRTSNSSARTFTYLVCGLRNRIRDLPVSEFTDFDFSFANAGHRIGNRVRAHACAVQRSDPRFSNSSSRRITDRVRNCGHGFAQ